MYVSESCCHHFFYTSQYNTGTNAVKLGDLRHAFLMCRLLYLYLLKLIFVKIYYTIITSNIITLITVTKQTKLR